MRYVPLNEVDLSCLISEHPETSQLVSKFVAILQLDIISLNYLLEIVVSSTEQLSFNMKEEFLFKGLQTTGSRKRYVETAIKR